MYLVERSNNYDSLTLLKISKNEMKNPGIFCRVEEKEFRYKNKMYDFAREIDKEDTVYFYCMEDKNEVILDDLFAGCFSAENDNKKNNDETKIVIRVLITEAVAGLNMVLPQITSNDINFPVFDKRHSSFISLVNTPPPKLSLSV